MKKLLLFVAIVTLFGCNNAIVDVKDPYKETTCEIQRLAEIDTAIYKIVIQDNSIYLLNTKTNLVDKRIEIYVNSVGEKIFAIIFFLVLGVVCFFLLYAILTF